MFVLKKNRSNYGPFCGPEIATISGLSNATRSPNVNMRNPKAAPFMVRCKLQTQSCYRDSVLDYFYIRAWIDAEEGGYWQQVKGRWLHEHTAGGISLVYQQMGIWVIRLPCIRLMCIPID